MASWEILCVHCTKEKTRRLDYRWLFWVCWQHMKGDNCGTPTPPKQQWSRKILPVSELDMDLPFLPAMLLAKPSFVNLQNALFILIAFHIALLLNKKLILCRIHYSNGQELVEFTGLIIFPIVLKQLA